MSDDDSGLPEESQNILEQENAVPVKAVGPYYKFGVSGRQIFENIEDLYEYGTDIIYGRGRQASRAHTLFIVVDNADEADLLYPNQPHYWIAERLPPSPEYIGDDENFRGDVFFTPFYKKMVEWAEEGRRGIPPPPRSIIAGTYRNVSVYLPDPTLDYSRPTAQTGDTTGATTGTTVRTTTTVTPGAAGGVTESEIIPAEVDAEADLDAFGGAGTPVTQTAVAGGRGTVVEQPGARAAALAQQQVTGGRGNGAAEVAQRRADSAAASLTTANVTTGTDPCLPNNPPAASGTTGSGATPPASVPYDDAILRQARAASATAGNAANTATTAAGNAANTATTAAGNAANTASNRAAAAAGVTAPTTITQPPSTPTSSSTAPTRSSNVYIYEPLTPGFDRYDFNSGKKVYTPDSGPSRNTSSQPVVQQSVPRTPPGANRDPRQTGPF